MLFESNSIDKNFDEIISEINKLKDWTMKKVNKLEQTSNLQKIQQFKKLKLEDISLNKENDSGFFTNAVYLKFNIDNSTYDLLKHKHEFFKNLIINTGYNTTSIKVKILEDNTEGLNNMKQLINSIYQLDQVFHETNLSILKNNKQIQDTVFYILDMVGISDTYYDYKTARSNSKTKMHYKFTSEIRQQIPTYYTEDKLNELKEKRLKEIDNIWNGEIEKIHKEKLRKEQEQKEKEKNKKLALLLAKYDLDLNNDWNDILIRIIDRNKYLYLAHYLQMNRGDWSSGSDYAEVGLRKFDIENELDQKIHDDINHYIENWENHMDGRVFRDCEYNYSVLFGIVADTNKDLLNDYNEVYENVDLF